MPRLMGITLPPGTDNFYHRVATIYNRKVKCIIGVKPDRKARKYGNTARANSTLKVTAATWRAFSAPQKLAWKNAALPESKTGYNLFTRDQNYRNKNGIAGSATPNTLHQFFLGSFNNAGAAANLTCKIGRSFVPAKTMTLTANAKGVLVGGGGPASATLVVKVKRYFIGQTFVDVFSLPLDLSSAFKAYSLAITNGPGALALCDFYLEVVNCNGTLYLDDVELIANGNVYNDDPWCNNVESSFVPVGAVGAWEIASIYPPDGL